MKGETLGKGWVYTARGKKINFAAIKDKATGSNVKQEPAPASVVKKAAPPKKALNVRGHMPSMVTETVAAPIQTSAPVLAVSPSQQRVAPAPTPQVNYTSVKVDEKLKGMVKKKGAEGANEVMKDIMESLSETTKDATGFKDEEIL